MNKINLLLLAGLFYSSFAKGELCNVKPFNLDTLDTDHVIFGGDLSKKLNNKCEFAGPLHHKIKISELWAQQMTGADLVREELEKDQQVYKIQKEDILILDVYEGVEGGHGDSVVNLIAGPHKSALIPSKYSLPFVHASSPIGFQNAAENCLNKNKACPKFLSNSTIWDENIDEIAGEKKAEVIKALASQGTISVVASGNDPFPVEAGPSSIAKDIILVAASTSSGEPTWWSNHSPEVVISAPSDEILNTYYYNGEKTDFGGTSGAAPQVTAALLNFYKISGFHPSIGLAKKLLRNTALPHLGSPEKNRYGAGMLNSYKIHKLAQRLKELCKNKDRACYEDAMEGENFYKVEITSNESQKVIQEAYTAFPGCEENNGDIETNCNIQKEIFNNVRRLSLLNPSMTEAWKLLDCITSLSSYQRNNTYYARMSGRKSATLTTQTTDQVDFYVQETLTTDQYRLAITELMSNEVLDIDAYNLLIDKAPKSLPLEHKDLVLGLLELDKNKDEQSYISNAYDSLRLGDPIFSDSPEIISSLLARNNEEVDEIIAELYIWQDHWPEDKQKVWRETILERSNDNDYLFLFYYYHYSSRDNEDFIKNVINRGNVDSHAITQLPISFWISNEKDLFNLIKRGNALDSVVRQLIPSLPDDLKKRVTAKIKTSNNPIALRELERINSLK